MSHDQRTDEEKIAEYRANLLLIHMAARTIAKMDIPKMLDDIERSHAIGPMLDPTLYRDKRKAMEEDAELLRAALPLYKLGRK